MRCGSRECWQEPERSEGNRYESPGWDLNVLNSEVMGGPGVLR